MNKFTTLAVVVGLVSAFTTMSSSAAIILNHVPKTPNVPSEHNEPTNCADEMGHMRSVSPADISAIRNQHVALVAVCEDLSVAGKNNYGPLFINGNAELLRLPIAHNGTLMSALQSKDYDQNDVVSVRFGGNDSIILYVYQRDMR